MMGVLIEYVPIPLKHQHRGVRRNAVALSIKNGRMKNENEYKTNNSEKYSESN